MKKFFKWTGIVLLIVIGGLYIVIELMHNRKFDAPLEALQTSSDSAVLARGRYLVYGPAHCASCHAPASEEHKVDKGEEVPLTGGRMFDLPIGKIYSANITPHSTGIGEMSDGEFLRALRYGVGRKGKALFDFMPFHNTSDEDMAAILSYLRSQPAVENKVPGHSFNLLGKAVKAFMIKPVGPSGPVPEKLTRDTSAAYGAYLANYVANCRGCHTNRDLMTGAYTGPDFAGGLMMETATDSGVFVITSPNLTPDATGRIKGWSQQQFIDRFRIGKIIPQTHMPWGPFSRMSDDELKAIYQFLQTLQPVANQTPAGARRKVAD